MLLECYVVMGAGWLWYRGRRAAPISGFGNAVVLAGASAVIAVPAGAGVAAGLQHDHRGPAAAEADRHRPADNRVDVHHRRQTPPTAVAPPRVADTSHHTDAGRH